MGLLWYYWFWNKKQDQESGSDNVELEESKEKGTPPPYDSNARNQPYQRIRSQTSDIEEIVTYSNQKDGAVINKRNTEENKEEEKEVELTERQSLISGYQD